MPGLTSRGSPPCRRGANGGANGRVSGERWSSLASPNSLKTRRPALACAGRAGLRIESSTPELRWRGPKLAACGSTRYSTPSARWRTWPKCPRTLKTCLRSSHLQDSRHGGCQDEFRSCVEVTVHPNNLRKIE